MESKVTKSESTFYNFVGWADANKNKIIGVAVAVAVVAVVVAFMAYRSSEREKAASEALSELRAQQSAPNAPAAIPASEFLRLADANENTAAGQRALLLGAGALFTEGNYSEAQAKFESFLKDYPDSPSRGEALLGAAASLEAQGKTAEAIARYKEVTDRFGGSPAALQAKFALARQYEAEGKADLALKLYEEVQREDQSGSLGGYHAKVAAGNLLLKHPNLKGSQTTVPKLP